MKVTDVKTAIVRGNFNWLLVRVETDEGLNGLGECWGEAGVKDLIRSKVRPLLMGEDPMDIGRLFLKVMRNPPTPAGAQVTAWSGVEMALWDIAGKKLEAPIYRLLGGGKYRDRVRVYADSHAGKDYAPESYAERALEVKARGFGAIKFDVDHLTPYQRLDYHNLGLSNAEARHIVSVVAAVREAIGDDVDLAIDAHWSYNVADAVKVAKRLEPYNLMWFEDPVPYDNPETVAKVSASTSTPICVGEHLFTRHGFRELIVRQAVAVIAPDMANSGGLLECKKIADMAETYTINMAPHNICSPVATLAAAHACAAIPNFLALEFHSQDVPWWDDLVTGIEKPIIKDGFIRVPERPGLGVELNEEVARKHLAEGEQLF
ncbi:MAG: mandelate racemase/muconate lactonizing enzyme family protein [Candidatus Bathyarchaeia archaeon]